MAKTKTKGKERPTASPLTKKDDNGKGDPPKPPPAPKITGEQRGQACLQAIQKTLKHFGCYISCQLDVVPVGREGDTAQVSAKDWQVMVVPDRQPPG